MGLLSLLAPDWMMTRVAPIGVLPWLSVCCVVKQAAMCETRMAHRYFTLFQLQVLANACPLMGRHRKDTPRHTHTHTQSGVL
jgi:hypothetical protein